MRAFSRLATSVGFALSLLPCQAQSQNPLPAPNHPMDFGYYHVDGRYGDYRSDVNCYTNLYRAGKDNYLSTDDWRARIAVSLQDAWLQNRRIDLALNMDPAENGDIDADLAEISDLLDIARPYWSRVVRIEIADEPRWAPAGQINRRIFAVRDLLDAKGLPRKPLGAVYNPDEINGLPFPNKLSNSAYDWVGIEAYVNPGEASPSTCDNVATLYQKVRTAKEQIGCEKGVVLVMMAYDRNGCWPYLPLLPDLQIAAYLIAHNDPRVSAITMFSYGREGTSGCNCGTACGGAHFHPHLVPAHKRIGERILGLSEPPVCGGGPPPGISLPPCAGPPSSCGGSGGGGGSGNLRYSVVGFQVDLVWNHFGSDVVEYRIQHKDSPDGDWLPIGRVPADTTSFSDSVRQPTGVADEHFYRVRAWHGSGGPFSNEVRAVVYREAPSAMPALLSPSGCAGTVRPTFSWRSVPRGTHYYLKVAVAGTSDFVINQPGIVGTTYTPDFDLELGRTYRWSVKATNNIGPGPWSPDFQFTTVCGPTTPPTELSPTGCSALRPTFSWTAVPGVTNYRLVATLDDPEAFFLDVYPTATSYTPPFDLQAGALHRWKVRGVNAGVPGPWSSNGRFFTPGCTAPTVTSVTPRAGPRGGGTQITITGTGFLVGAGTTVTVGGAAATSVTVISPTTVRATTASSVSGPADLVVSVTGRGSATLLNGYTYLAPSLFTDDPLVAGVTVVKAQHLNELRQSVNSLRFVAGLPAAAWTDPSLTAGVTLIRAVHVAELRVRLNEALAALGYATPPYTDPTLAAGATVVRRIHLEELRQRVRSVTN